MPTAREELERLMAMQAAGEQAATPPQMGGGGGGIQLGTGAAQPSSNVNPGSMTTPGGSNMASQALAMFAKAAKALMGG